MQAAEIVGRAQARVLDVADRARLLDAVGQLGQLDVGAQRFPVEVAQRLADRGGEGGFEGPAVGARLFFGRELGAFERDWTLGDDRRRGWPGVERGEIAGGKEERQRGADRGAKSCST